MCGSTPKMGAQCINKLQFAPRPRHRAPNAEWNQLISMVRSGEMDAGAEDLKVLER